MCWMEGLPWSCLRTANGQTKVTAVGGQTDEHGIKVILRTDQQSHVISILRGSITGVSCDSQQAWHYGSHHLFSPSNDCQGTLILNDIIKVEVEECWGQDASLAYSTNDQEPSDTFPYTLTPAVEPACTAWITGTTLAGRP